MPLSVRCHFVMDLFVQNVKLLLKLTLHFMIFRYILCGLNFVDGVYGHAQISSRAGAHNLKAIATANEFV